MVERPIIFSGPMVRGILENRKTMTRRILKPQPFPVGGPFYRPHPVASPQEWHSVSSDGHTVNIQKAPYAVGDRLWVKEVWAVGVFTGNSWNADSGPGSPSPKMQRRYRADGEDGFYGKWRSPRFMPRWASRITLEVTEVRVQRLQEISHTDAKAEGVAQWVSDYFEPQTPPSDLLVDFHCGTTINAFRRLWETLHGPDAWVVNPWVAAISFKRIT